MGSDESLMEYRNYFYRQDMENEAEFKRRLRNKLQNCNYPFFTKIRAMALVNKLCRVDFFLEETEMYQLDITVELWNCSFLGYNVNKISEYIYQNKISKTQVELQPLVPYFMYDFEQDLTDLLHPELRASKEKNPEIILVNECFCHPFVVNGNHRLMSAYKKGEISKEVYVLDADTVVDCLFSDGFKEAYRIYKKLHKLIGFGLYI